MPYFHILICNLGIANPIACIRSAAMICAHLGMQEEGRKIEEAISKAVISGVKTRFFINLICFLVLVFISLFFSGTSEEPLVQRK